MKWLTLFILPLAVLPGIGAKYPLFGAPGNGDSLFVSHFENVLGTSMELEVLAVSAKQASTAEAAATKEIARLQKILSAYDTNSEFSGWLRTSNKAIAISPELFEVLSLFDQWRIASGGALDASAEIITKLWKQAATRQRIPTERELTSAVMEVKQLHWKLDPLAHTATHLDQAPLMLNSFAKSYVIRRAADAAMASGNVRAVVVNIGGDIVIAGSLRETVRISDPKADAENDPAMDELVLANRAAATSGNYRRGELIGGHWYSHIVDPRTGIPADSVISVTVVSPTATDAGALATAFNVLTPGESIRLASQFPGVDYLIITRAGAKYCSIGWHLLESASGRKLSMAATRPMSINVPPEEFELVINLQMNFGQEGFAKRPYVAVWVEDDTAAPVRTIALWHGSYRYLPELSSWYLKYHPPNAAYKIVVSTVSSATRPAGKYVLKWDGKNDLGKPVKPGKYVVKIELSREHGTYQLMRQELNWNGNPQRVELADNVELSHVSLDYRKKIVGN